MEFWAPGTGLTHTSDFCEHLGSQSVEVNVKKQTMSHKDTKNRWKRREEEEEEEEEDREQS